MKLNRKASIFIYIILLINITMIFWYIVYNNTFIINNNIDVWKNAEEVFLTLTNKANINIDTVKKYNWNWWWFVDWISCPTNITMSWNTEKEVWLPTTMINNLWVLSCSWDYDWETFRIYFDENVENFSNVYFWWAVKNLEFSSNTEIELWTNNVAENVTVSSSYEWLPNEYANDWKNNTYFESWDSRRNEWISFNLWTDRSVWKIIIRKPYWYNWSYWNKWIIELKDRFWNIIDPDNPITISWIRKETYYEIDLKYRWLSKDVRYITLISSQKKYLTVSELEVYELESTWSEEVWQGNGSFNDWDNTYFEFDADWITWWDWIDDDLNSDNYRVTSIWDLYYQDWYQDDDVIPRLTIFSNLEPKSDYYNVFWNNYKTNKIIEENINNDDILNIKASQVTDWYLYFDLFSENNILYDIKLLEFDRNEYKDNYTLFPINSYHWFDLTEDVWYLQNNWWDISLSRNKTWNEFVFNFKDKDYAIFFKNKELWNIAVRLTGENNDWKQIYINPIDDSKSWIIESLTNHIIIGWEKNFIWEHFLFVWDK